MLVWGSMAECEQRWGACLADPNDHADRREQPGDHLDARLGRHGRAREAVGRYLLPNGSRWSPETEKDGQLVETISSQLLAPAAFSAVT